MAAGFEDQLRVGDRIASATRAVTARDIRDFAELTGDTHPQHLDADWARSSPFGERIAHGLLVLSISLGLVELDPERVIALRGLRGLVFKRPTRIGEPVRVDATVSGIRPTGNGIAVVELKWDVLGEDDRRLIRGQIDLLWSLPGSAPTAKGDDQNLFEGEVFL
jgi:3-hydroxybutyryl-CoA dehydratase